MLTFILALCQTMPATQPSMYQLQMSEEKNIQSRETETFFLWGQRSNFEKYCELVTKLDEEMNSFGKLK